MSEKVISKEAEKTFFPQPIKDTDKFALELIRTEFANLYDAVDNECPDGRFKSMVKTKLEEAALFATKSFTHS